MEKDAGEDLTYFANLTRWHWVVYEGGLKFDDAGSTVFFGYHCEDLLSVHKKLRASIFNTSFYGYVKGV